MPEPEVDQLVQLLVAEGTAVVAAFAAAHALHPTDVGALVRVKVAEDLGAPLTAGELGRALRLTSGSVTALVDRLVARGHLERARDPHDGRRVLLRYAAPGRRLAESFFAGAREHTVGATTAFTADELDAVRRFLTVAVAGMAEHRGRLEGRPASG